MQFKFVIIMLLLFVGNARINAADTLFYHIDSIVITGNKTTKERIITREIPFEKGDSVNSISIDEQLGFIWQNLMNTSLFNFVEVTYEKKNENNIIVNVSLTERWYIWPVPIFQIEERNFNSWLDNPDLNRATYGFDLTHNNFIGRKQYLSIKFRGGYTQSLGLSYSVPYLDKEQKHGFGISGGYARRREVYFATINNRLTFYKNPDSFVRKEYSISAYYRYRRIIYNTHTIGLRYYNGTVDDTVTVLGKDYPYYLNNDTGMSFLSLNYRVVRDRRNYKYYPLTGYYFDFEVIKYGLGILKREEIDNIFFFTNIKKYWQLANRSYFASSIKVKASGTGKQPYAVMRAFGFNTYVRGYEHLVVDGYNYILAKTGFKYELIKPKERKIPFIKMEQFGKFWYALYARVYFDAGYVDNSINAELNRLNNEWLFGTGAGLDIVTYYDGVLRFEYSFNKLGQSGLFLHITAPL